MRKGLAFLLVFGILFMFQTSFCRAEWLTLPSAAFIPKDHNTSWTTNGVYLESGGAQSSTFYAPVILPVNAYIKTVHLVAQDDSGGDLGGYVQLQLIEYSNTTVNDYMATLTSGGAWGSGLIEDNIELNQSIDNPNFIYGFDLRIVHGTAGTLRFLKCAINYEIPQNVISGPLP